MVTVNFKEPVTVGSATYASCEINEPTILQIKAAQQARNASLGDAGETTMMMTLAQLISGLPIQAIEKLVISDFNKVAEAIASFLKQT
jgi:hypothetical protein